MARQNNTSPRRPATKFAHLRKKLQKAKIAGKKDLKGRVAKGSERPPLRLP
jgi:hypothetical protein